MGLGIFARHKSKPDRAQALSAVPVRNPAIGWNRVSDVEVALDVPMRDDALARLAKKFVKNLPETRRVLLDETAGRVWELIDGKLSVNDIISGVCNEFKLTRRQSEVSTSLFLETLSKKGFIAFMDGKAEAHVKKRK